MGFKRGLTTVQAVSFKLRNHAFSLNYTNVNPIKVEHFIKKFRILHEIILTLPFRGKQNKTRLFSLKDKNDYKSSKS